MHSFSSGKRPKLCQRNRTDTSPRGGPAFRNPTSRGPMRLPFEKESASYEKESASYEKRKTAHSQPIPFPSERQHNNPTHQPGIRRSRLVHCT